jgi:hypothetical protein
VHSSSRAVPRLCERCGSRQARFYPVTILGALCLAQRAVCEECHAEEVAEAERRGPPAEGDFTVFGPIQFETLLESLPGAEEHEPPDLQGWYADRVREIARAHRQAIPEAVESFLGRFEAARDGSGTA